MMDRMPSLRSITVCALHAFLAGATLAQTYALRSARVFDSTTAKISSLGLVVVANGKIESVGGSVPAGAEVIDLGNATLMPGFIDAHTHLTDDFNPDYNGAMLKNLQMPIAERAILPLSGFRQFPDKHQTLDAVRNWQS
jgi:imidazolonepropionase-like amidohydrolase